MQPSAHSIVDDHDAPLFAPLFDCFSRHARVRSSAARRERPVLDGCRLLEVCIPFLFWRAEE